MCACGWVDDWGGLCVVFFCVSVCLCVCMIVCYSYMDVLHVHLTVMQLGLRLNVPLKIMAVFLFICILDLSGMFGNGM